MSDWQALLESVADVEPSPGIPHEAWARAAERDARRARAHIPGMPSTARRRIRRGAVVLALAAAVVAVLALTVIAGHRSSAQRPAGGGVFGQTAGWLTVGGYHLRLVDPDRPSHERTVPDGLWMPPRWAASQVARFGNVLDWSSDGSKLLLKRPGGLFLLDQAGGLTRVAPLHLRPRGYIGTAGLTADGSEVVFEGPDDSVYRVPAAGGQPKRIVGPGSHLVYGRVVGNPVSPDGTTVVYPHASAHGRGDAFWLVNARGGGQRRLVTLGLVRSRLGLPSSGEVDVLGWLAAGKLLLAASDDKVIHCQTFSVDVNGGHLRPWGPPGLCPWSVTPSPDGRRVAVVSGRVDPSRVTIFDLEGTHGRLVPRDIVRPSRIDYVVAWRP